MKKIKIRSSVLVLFLLSGCTVAPVVKDEPANSPMIAVLEEEVRGQREEIVKLQNRLKLLESAKKVAAARPVKPVASKKTKISKTRIKAAHIPKDEDMTIADSSHEELHKYFRGVQLIRDKKVDEGLILLREFISENPNHVYADRAEMAIADCHYKSKDYALVIVSTNVLEAKYPHSTKLPEALYKKAMAFIALDQKDQAKKTLEKIIVDYPKTKMAEVAGKKMASLKAPLLTDLP